MERLTGLAIYGASVCEVDGVTYCLGRRGREKLVATLGEGVVAGRTVGQRGGRPVVVGPTDHDNAEAVRAALPWTAPRLIGLAGSMGFGDRLGLATPGHIRAVRGSGLACVLAQQSIRELTRTQRTAEEVMDAATWGVLQEGFREGFGSDADHLQKPEDIGVMAAAGFTMFTIDPSEHVDDEADALDATALAERYAALDFDALEASANDLKSRYAGKTLRLEGGGEVAFDEETFARAAVKYARAVAHTAMMSRRLADLARGAVELEVSVDETERPTSPAEHYFFAAEMRRMGVAWVSLAPRFVGGFEKGVDYIGDLGDFRRSFARHVAVMRTLGPYKISVHSGSDKFSIYPHLVELAGGLVHVKTAGANYLAALHTIAYVDPPLFREILDVARGCYESDRATYHVSADVSKVPSGNALRDDQLPGLLEQFDARQVLHVTFGSVLMAGGGELFGTRIRGALLDNEEAHYASLERLLGRHVEALSRVY